MRAAWQREGRYLRSRGIRRIPFVGPWLAEHVPRWRKDSPQRKAGAAAARRARVMDMCCTCLQVLPWAYVGSEHACVPQLSQAQATAHSEPSQHALATGSPAASTPASIARAAAEQQPQSGAGTRKQRNRKRAKRR